MKTKKNTQQTVADTLRVFSYEMVEKANSGHIGMPLGFADAITALLYEINFDPSLPNWINRDRIIFSCGHGCSLWYSILYGFGLLAKTDLEQFRQIDSKTPGHPEKSPGIDLSTGPLGMGFAWAVGMAFAERILNAKNEAIDHFTYIICSDGDLMEGISYETTSIAGHYKLHKIIALWDDNSVTIDGPTNLSISEDTQKRFLAQGWNFIRVNGHNIFEVTKAIKNAKKNTKPTLIACKTIIGKYSQFSSTNLAHGFIRTKGLLDEMKCNLAYNEKIFFDEFEKIKIKNLINRQKWQEKYDNTIAKKDIILSKSENLKEKLQQNCATRKHSEYILEELIKQNDNLVICSADLSTSCGTWPKNGKAITCNDYNGNILPCGVRENAMVAIAGGITEHSILTGICSTFLVFYDYARPSIRLAAMMQTPMIMIATHDSIAVGEDGPTHQPIEQLDSLRCIPNLLVARPADGFETYYCYEEILKHKKPAILALTRQNVPNIHKNFIARNDLIFFENYLKNGIIITTGSELNIAIEAAMILKLCIISLPIIQEKNVAEIKKLIEGQKIFVIEASSCMALCAEFSNIRAIKIRQFGISCKAEIIVEKMNLTPTLIVKWINEINKK